MNTEQLKAAAAVRRALAKAHKAGLGIRVYEAVYVYDPAEFEAHPDRNDAPARALDDVGIDVGHPDMPCDGGAGV